MKQIFPSQLWIIGRRPDVRALRSSSSPGRSRRDPLDRADHLYELIRAGEIKSVQVGRLRRVPVMRFVSMFERLKAQTPDRLEAARPGQL